MEVIKKHKKLKKRRHRNQDDQTVEPLDELKSFEDTNSEVVKRGGAKCNRHISLKNDQAVQTEDFNISESKDSSAEKDEQIKSLTDRLQQITNKLYESKNAYTSLKQDFNKAQKLLCSEVGENVTVTSLSSQPGGWRGRAEQIQHLQQKVAELQQKIPISEPSIRKQSLDRRSSSSARLFDREKKQQIENLNKELKETETTLENTNKKLEAARARIAVLENNLNSSKKAVSLLNEKTTHDNQLIEALHNQLKSAESKFQDREIAIKRQNEKFEREMILLKSELEASQLHIKNFQRQLDERNQEIDKLRHGITERTALHPLQNNILNSSPTQSPRSLIKDPNEYIAMTMAAEAERERLLEFVTVLNKRLDKERNDYEILSESLKKERSRAAKLETKLQKVEMERVGLSRVNSGSYRSRAPKPVVNSNNGIGDLEEFRLKYELLQEECLTLKTRLATIQKDKASDLAIFKKMLEQTRKIFKDAYNKGKLPPVGFNSTITI